MGWLEGCGVCWRVVGWAGGLWGGWRVVGWLEGCGVAGGLWGGWRVVGWVEGCGVGEIEGCGAAQLLGGSAVAWRRRVSCGEAVGAEMAVFRLSTNMCEYVSVLVCCRHRSVSDDGIGTREGST